MVSFCPVVKFVGKRPWKKEQGILTSLEETGMQTPGYEDWRVIAGLVADASL